MRAALTVDSIRAASFKGLVSKYWYKLNFFRVSTPHPLDHGRNKPLAYRRGNPSDSDEANQIDSYENLVTPIFLFDAGLSSC